MKALEISNFPGYYVTDSGEVFSRICNNFFNKECRITRKAKTKQNKGYWCVTLRKDGKTYVKTVHRLVAQMFIQNTQNKPFINHKNGIRTDNRVENLEWVTNSENIKHAFNVLGHTSPMKGRSGIRHPNSHVIQQMLNGKVINEFYGTKEAFRHTGVNYRNIHLCIKGLRKTAGGFNWKLKDM